MSVGFRQLTDGDFDPFEAKTARPPFNVLQALTEGIADNRLRKPRKEIEELLGMLNPNCPDHNALRLRVENLLAPKPRSA